MSESIQLLEKLVSSGRYLEARELATKLIQSSEGNTLRTNQLMALSLSKSGAPQEALEHLEPVYRQHPDDAETAGIMGSIYKELFKKHRDTKYAIQSRDTYSKNFSASQNYYTGINAATMSAIAGRASQSREIAGQVITLIGEGTNFWELATLGEAHLLTKNRNQSNEYFVKSRQMAGTDWGKIISVYNQLWLLNHYVPVPKEIITLFSPPNVAAFVGHMIDRPERGSPRFPLSIEDKIKTLIQGAIRTLKINIGYCSLACGGDVLFAESMAEAGGEVHLFLPFKKDDFINTSVRFAGDGWVERFNNLVEKYPTTYLTDEPYEGRDELFSLQSRIIFGSATLRSAVYHNEPQLITVLSETDLKRKVGGTRDTIRYWPFPERHLNINPDQFHSITAETPRIHVDTSGQKEPSDRPILYLVLVDLTGAPAFEKESVNKIVLTKTSDELIPYKAIQRSDETILVAFETEVGALDFVQLILDQKPLKTERSAKINVHVGPVSLKEMENETFEILNCESLETITRMSTFSPAGLLMASGTFASLLALNAKKFQLDYAGALEDADFHEKLDVYAVSIKQR